MTIERAAERAVPKPWGSTDLRPWSDRHQEGAAIGEIWFQRPGTHLPDPALLLKLLFPTEPLSIQVHPGDDYARSIGLPHGKTEAWYILSATPDAKVAIGLKRHVTAAELRAAIGDGSIADLVAWRQVSAGDVVSVPAGTIHALGAGLVVAEVQQNSDATFRLFDYGRHRELHIDQAVAVAKPEPSAGAPAPAPAVDGVTPLVSSPFFAMERLDLPAGAAREIQAARETWLLVLNGTARVGTVIAATGQAIFLEATNATLCVGAGGLTALLAKVGPEQNPILFNNRHPAHAG